MRLIDADALKNRLEDLRSYTMLGEECLYYDGETNALSVAIQSIDNALTVDTVPMKHGQWEQVFEERTIHGSHCSAPNFRCSVCKKWWFHNGECVKWMKYCPECGAKMDGEKVSE